MSRPQGRGGGDTWLLLWTVTSVYVLISKCILYNVPVKKKIYKNYLLIFLKLCLSPLRKFSADAYTLVSKKMFENQARLINFNVIYQDFWTWTILVLKEKKRTIFVSSVKLSAHAHCLKFMVRKSHWCKILLLVFSCSQMVCKRFDYFENCAQTKKLTNIRRCA